MLLEKASWKQGIQAILSLNTTKLAEEMLSIIYYDRFRLIEQNQNSSEIIHSRQPDTNEIFYKM